MRQLMLQAPFHLTWRDVPQPTPSVGNAVISVKAVGMCGSDLSAYRGDNEFQIYPCVPGHEIGGEVVAVDGTAESLRVGDRVAVEPLVSCGTCGPCVQGRYNCCIELEVLGVNRNGGMVEFLEVPVQMLHVAPANTSFELLALCEPMAVGLHAVRRARVRRGDKVVVIGAGTIGLGAMQAAKVAGAIVGVIDISPVKLDLARRLGADFAIDIRSGEPSDLLRHYMGPDGADVAIEAVGRAQTIRLTVDLVGHAGRVVIVGHSKEDVSLPAHKVVRKEIDFMGSRNSRSLFPEILQLMYDGRIDALPLVSHRYPFERAIDAYVLWHTHQDTVNKILLTFNDE